MINLVAPLEQIQNLGLAVDGTLRIFLVLGITPGAHAILAVPKHLKLERVVTYAMYLFLSGSGAGSGAGAARARPEARATTQVKTVVSCMLKIRLSSIF